MTDQPTNARRAKGCPECGAIPQRKSAKGPAPLYCSNECKRTFQNRQAVEGRALIGFAKGWRQSRNHRDDKELGAACFARMCSTLDYMAARDRNEGRTVAMTLGYADWLVRNTDSYMDASSSIRWHRDRAEKPEQPEAAPAPAPAADPLAALRAKLADEATGDNERAVLQAALEIMQAQA